jgi:hypothetical protein
LFEKECYIGNVFSHKLPRVPERRFMLSSASCRYQHAWNDAAAQHKKKLLPTAAAAGASLTKQQQGQPSSSVRYIPYGGVAQEKGMTVDTMTAQRNRGRQASGSGAAAGGSTSGSFGGSVGGGARSKQQRSMGGSKRGTKTGGRQQ